MGTQQLATRIFRTWMATLRWRMAAPVPSGPAVFAFWHRHVPTAAAFFRGWDATAMVSASQDGQFLVDLLAGGGLDLVRGSSSRGGSPAARRLLGAMRKGRSVVTAFDGPRGPSGVAKRGPAWLAKTADRPLYEVVFSPSRRLRLADWSRMEIPLPFSRVDVRFRALDPSKPRVGAPG